MSAGQLLGGTVLLALAAGSAATFAAIVVRRRLPALAGAPRGLAFALLFLGGFLGVQFVPGVLGVIGRPGVVVCCVLLAAGSLLIRPRQAPAREPEFPPGPESGRLSWGLAGGVAALYGVYLLAAGIDHGGVATQHVDMTTFHLPNVARWLQSGTFWQLDEFVPYRSFGTYPNTSDLLVLGVILPFDSDFLVPFVNYPLLGLTAAATYALGRELSAPAATAALFAVAVVAVPAITEFALDGLADTLMLATFACGLYFLLRQRRTQSTSDLVLAAVGLGISLGTKWYALAAVGAVVAVWIVARVLERVPLRRVLGQAVTLVGIVVLAGGFWMLRNVVEVGNPLYPQALSIAGLTILDAPRDLNRELVGFSLADYLGSPEIWRRYVWPGYLGIMGWLSVVLWVSLAGAAVLAVRDRARRVGDHRAVLACVVIAGVIGAVFVITPYTAFGPQDEPVLGWVTSRYVMPALIIGAAVAASVLGRLPARWRRASEVVAVVLFLDVLRRDPHVSAKAIAAGLVVVAGIAIAVLVWRRLPAGTGLRSARLAAGAVAVASIAVVALYWQEKRFNDGRYAEADAASRWVIANAPSGQRIGVVGEGFVVHPLFGPRLENEVEYVGPIVDGMLRPYATRRSFEAALSRERPGLVVVHDQATVVPGLPRRHQRWLRELGYELVASGRQKTTGGMPSQVYRAPSR